MASRRNIIIFLTAPARSGKSFNEVRRIVDVILPSERGVVYTNLPLYPDKIAEYCFDKYRLPMEETLSRLHVIPREIEEDWAKAGNEVFDPVSGEQIGSEPITGPWDYFAGLPLADSTIIIDEIHNFCGVSTPRPVAALWQKWIGEVSHDQAVFRCLSQSSEKVNRVIKADAQACYTIRNTGLDHDPYFKIEIYDWMELGTGLFGLPYKVFVFEQETRKVEGNAIRGKREMFLMGQPYFSFYNSFNAPIGHKQTANVKQYEREYEKHLKKGPVRGRISLLLWFVNKYLMELLTRILLAAGIIILIINFANGNITGGMMRTIKKITAGATSKAITKGTATDPEKPEGKPADIPITDKEKLLEQKITLLEEKTKLLTEAKTTLEDRLKDKMKLMLISEDSFITKEGKTYKQGDTIDSGYYQGKTVAKIDYQKRRATLDSGDVFALDY